MTSNKEIMENKNFIPNTVPEFLHPSKTVINCTLTIQNSLTGDSSKFVR